MEYLLNFNGSEYPLPVFTIAIKKEISRIDTQNANITISDETKYKSMVEFEKKILGVDAAREILETDNFEEMDLSKVTICYLGIVLAYDKPIQDYQNEINNSKLDDKTITQIISLAKSADTIMKASAQASKK